MKLNVCRPLDERLSTSRAPVTGWWSSGRVVVVVLVVVVVVVVVGQLPFGVFVHTATGDMSVQVAMTIVTHASSVQAVPSSHAGAAGLQRRAPVMWPLCRSES